MKTSIVPWSAIRQLLSTSFALFASANVLFAQGSLTPPGAPATTFKTLQQVEPRTDLQATPLPAGVTTDGDNHFIISSPGSYYLTANLIATKGKGIDITVAGVTVDLNGFQIRHATGGDTGIRLESAAHRCTIKNGSLSNFGSGIDAFGNGGRLLQITVSDCSSGLTSGEGWQIEGCTAHDNEDIGIRPKSGSIVSNCTAYNNQSDGFYVFDGCTVTNCTAYKNQGHGIHAFGGGCTIKDCAAAENLGTGIMTDVGCTIIGCSAKSNTGDGISAGDGSTISKCTVRSNHQNGVKVVNSCTVEGNTAQFNATSSTVGTPLAGIYVSSAGNRIEANNFNQHNAAGASGLKVISSGNVIIRNSGSNNTGSGGNFSIVAGNTTGTIVTTEAAMNAASNSNVNISF